MHSRSSGLLGAGVVILLGPALSLNAAHAGAKHIHNMSVKAQCITDAGAKN